jgi:hypothetical protein
MNEGLHPVPKVDEEGRSMATNLSSVSLSLARLANMAERRAAARARAAERAERRQAVVDLKHYSDQRRRARTRREQRRAERQRERVERAREHARLEGVRDGAQIREAIEADGAARLGVLRAEQTHELELERARANHKARGQRRRMFAAVAACLCMTIGFGAATSCAARRRNQLCGPKRQLPSGTVGADGADRGARQLDRGTAERGGHPSAGFSAASRGAGEGRRANRSRRRRRRQDGTEATSSCELQAAEQAGKQAAGTEAAGAHLRPRRPLLCLWRVHVLSRHGTRAAHVSS